MRESCGRTGGWGMMGRATTPEASGQVMLTGRRGMAGGTAAARLCRTVGPSRDGRTQNNG
ncbi:MAG: hypothetical protein JSR62_04050 [Nitrospira sp.]|nr:hypothetical protein [Nitrospira sp.]